MAIKDVEEKLYKREADLVEKKSLEFGTLNSRSAGPSAARLSARQGQAVDQLKRSEEQPFAPVTISENIDKEKELWIKAEEEKKIKRKKILKTVGIVSVAAVCLAGLVWGTLYWRKTAFSEDKVKVSVFGPEKVQSGESVTFEITFENLNRTALKDAVLYLNYSENFKPSGNLQFESEGSTASKYQIGSVAKKSNGKISFQGRFYGPKDFLAYMSARLEYRSSNFNSVFKAENRASVFISSTPLLIEVSGPLNVPSGGGISYVVSLQNGGQEEFKDLKVKAEYPTGFSFSGSEPLPAMENNVWYVGSLSAGQKSEVRISGTLEGMVQEIKTARIYVGEFGNDGDFISYGEAESQAKIVGSVIALTQTVNDKKDELAVNAGDILIFKIHYKNTGQVGLRDVILTEEIKSSVLDYSKLDMREKKGSLDSEKGIITWRSSGVPELALLDPGEEGEISFSIPVKDVIPVSGTQDKNFLLKAVAKMDSPDVPTPEGTNKIIPSNTLNVKLNSKLVIAEEGYYNDSEISNSGPLPLKVGQETTFAMHLKVSNVSNDVTDAKVVVTIAPGVKWKNNFLPKNADISFNERANELVWDIGTMPAGMGIVTSPKDLIFQIGIVPSQNQIGNYAALIDKTVFSVKDVFTGQELKAELGGKTTDLREDIGVGEGGKVVQ